MIPLASSENLATVPPNAPASQASIADRIPVDQHDVMEAEALRILNDFDDRAPRIHHARGSDAVHHRRPVRIITPYHSRLLTVASTSATEKAISCRTLA